MPMSEKDRELISLLSENARLSTAMLARKLNLSRTTVQARLERLERDGVITGYGVRLSDEFQRGIVRAHVMITLAPKALTKVTPQLEAIRAVGQLHSVSGGFDLIAVVSAGSIQELDLIIDRIGDIDGVERTQSSIILSTRIDR